MLALFSGGISQKDFSVIAKAHKKPLQNKVMPTVGEQLCSAREERKLDLKHVGEVTKIRTDHLRALETGDFNQFAAPVYIRGFVRTYATLLKLDVPKIMAALDQELSQTKNFREPPALMNPAGGRLDFLMLQLSRLNWRVVAIGSAVVVLLILGVAIFGSRRKLKSESPLPKLGSGLYPSKQGGEMLPLPTNAPPR
ncbi:MAG TPA: helix-turn-helix domain-containing protein [Candidatus Eisenbacteria bacterium]|nr:helix-turn-helix domain-containing protein [Candidatus Eisenbacteria bacterium]